MTQAKDASCCAQCRANAQCEFWVRDTASTNCWLKRAFRRFTLTPTRRGNFRSLARLLAAIHTDVFDRLRIFRDSSVVTGMEPSLAARLANLHYGTDGGSRRVEAPTSRLFAEAVSVKQQATDGAPRYNLGSFGSCAFHHWLRPTSGTSRGSQAARCGATWVQRPQRDCNANRAGAVSNIGSDTRGTLMECKARCLATAGCNCVRFRAPLSNEAVPYPNAGYCSLRKDCAYGRRQAQMQMCDKSDYYDVFAVQPGSPAAPCNTWECAPFTESGAQKWRALCNGKDAAVTNPPVVPGGFGETFDSAFDAFPACRDAVARKAVDAAFKCPTPERADEWRCVQWKGYWTALCNGAPATVHGVFVGQFQQQHQVRPRHQRQLHTFQSKRFVSSADSVHIDRSMSDWRENDAQTSL